MSNSMSLQANLPSFGATASGGGSTTVRPKAAAAPETPAPAVPEAKPPKLYVNPDRRFDPTTGLVVIEFHDASGNLTNSIPTQRQLEAYRTHQQTPPGQPAPTHSNGAATTG